MTEQFGRRDQNKKINMIESNQAASSSKRKCNVDCKKILWNCKKWMAGKK